MNAIQELKENGSNMHLRLQHNNEIDHNNKENVEFNMITDSTSFTSSNTTFKIPQNIIPTTTPLPLSYCYEPSHNNSIRQSKSRSKHINNSSRINQTKKFNSSKQVNRSNNNNVIIHDKVSNFISDVLENNENQSVQDITSNISSSELDEIFMDMIPEIEQMCFDTLKFN